MVGLYSYLCAFWFVCLIGFDDSVGYGFRFMSLIVFNSCCVWAVFYLGVVYACAAVRFTF